MSVKAINWVWQNSKQKGGALLLELAIADFADDEGRAWPAIETLAKKARMTARNVSYLIEKKLKPAGLKIIPGGGRSVGGRYKSNSFQLWIPEVITLKSFPVNPEKFSPVSNFIPETHGSLTLKPISPNPSLNHHKKKNTHAQAEPSPLPHPHPAPDHPEKENRRGATASMDGDFERAWALYPKRAGGNSKKAAHEKWRASIRGGFKPDDLLAGVKRYADYIRATSTEGTQYVMQAERFFGPKELWRDDWAIPKGQQSHQLGVFVG